MGIASSADVAALQAAVTSRLDTLSAQIGEMTKALGSPPPSTNAGSPGPLCGQRYSHGPDHPIEHCQRPRGHGGGCDWPSAGLRGKR